MTDVRRVQVGEQFRVRVGSASIQVEVIEDRGNIGVGGRQLLGCRIFKHAPLGEPDFEDFEVAAEELLLRNV